MNAGFFKTLCIIITLMTCNSLVAQTLDEARQLYKAEKYAEAKPIFANLIKRTPQNASLNQWYGVCLLKTGEPEAAEKYLTFAVKKKILEANRYLGELYFGTYQFDKSIEAYENYIKLLKKDEAAIARITPFLEKSKLGSRMIKRVEEVQIIDSVIVNKDLFFKNYKLSPESGKIMDYNEFFESEHPVGSTVYQTQRGDKVLYAEPSGKSGYNIMSRSMLVDNQWSEAAALPKEVNTTYNENYPFLSSDGVTLYFASDGENSLGGYDIFVTRYNMNTGNYLDPENVGMPFNSPYNDYLLAIDEVNNIGWFATDRFQKEGNVIIYIFIPNVTKKIYRVGEEEGGDAETAKQLAMIKSIKKTWQPNNNYSDLLNRINNTQTVLPKEKKKDFVFVITDNILYTVIRDFESKEALELFAEAQSMKEKISDINLQLNKKRADYSKEPSNKQELNAEILSLETELLSLYGKVESLEIKARNTEINYLQTQSKK